MAGTVWKKVRPRRVGDMEFEPLWREARQLFWRVNVRNKRRRNVYVMGDAEGERRHHVKHTPALARDVDMTDPTCRATQSPVISNRGVRVGCYAGGKRPEMGEEAVVAIWQFDRETPSLKSGLSTRVMMDVLHDAFDGRHDASACGCHDVDRIMRVPVDQICLFCVVLRTLGYDANVGQRITKRSRITWTIVHGTPPTVWSVSDDDEQPTAQGEKARLGTLAGPPRVCGIPAILINQEQLPGCS
jgi:hypothetical protein